MEQQNNKNMWSSVKYLDNETKNFNFNFNGNSPFPNVYFISQDYRINHVRGFVLLLAILTPMMCYKMKAFQSTDEQGQEKLNLKKYLTCVLSAEVVYVLFLAYLSRFK